MHAKIPRFYGHPSSASLLVHLPVLDIVHKLVALAARESEANFLALSVPALFRLLLVVVLRFGRALCALANDIAVGYGTILVGRRRGLGGGLPVGGVGASASVAVAAGLGVCRGGALASAARSRAGGGGI